MKADSKMNTPLLGEAHGRPKEWRERGLPNPALTDSSSAATVSTTFQLSGVQPSSKCYVCQATGNIW